MDDRVNKPNPPAASTRGICIAEAVERTGLTERQLRIRKTRGLIRWRMRGRYLELHEEDVAALEVASWQGQPVQVKSRGQGAPGA